LLYFLLTLIIMPFTLNIAAFNLTDIAPTMIWVAIIPAILTSSSRLFSNDLDDGFIDRHYLMNITFELLFIIKICVLFICVILPLLCVIPIVALLFDLSLNSVIRIYAGLLSSLPAIAFFTGFGALLSIHAKMGHLLTFILVIPLIVPAIILGAGLVYTSDSVIDFIKFPIIFSLIAILITVPAGGFVYKQLYQYR